MAGAEPTVPWSSTMFTSPLAASSSTGGYATSHFAARRPSSTKSEPMKATQSESSFTSTLRSERMTGIFAALASRSTGSQPVSTTGEKAMTSTFWAMKERMALIWFSCFCCASENLRVMSALVAESLMDLVFAVRHSLSAPICEKPRTIFLSARASPAYAMVIPRKTVDMMPKVRFICLSLLWECLVAKTRITDARPPVTAGKLSMQSLDLLGPPISGGPLAGGRASPAARALPARCPVLLPLPVVSVGAVFPVEVLPDEMLWEARRGRCDGTRHERHPGDLFQDHGVVHCLLSRFSPGEIAVPGHQDHRRFRGIASPEAVEDLQPRLRFVIARCRLGAHQLRAGHVLVEVVGMCGPEDRDGRCRLGPAGRVRGMGMDHAAEASHLAEEHEVGPGVGGRSEAPLDDLSLEVQHDHVLDREILVRDAARLDGDQASLRIEGRRIAEGVDGEAALRDLQIRGPRTFLQLAMIRPHRASDGSPVAAPGSARGSASAARILALAADPVCGVVPAKLVLQGTKIRSLADADELDAEHAGEVLELCRGGGLAEGSVVGAASEDPPRAAALEVGAGDPDRARGGELRHRLALHGVHLVHDHPHAAAHVDQRDVDRRSGGSVEDEPTGICLAADVQGVHFQ